MLLPEQPPAVLDLSEQTCFESYAMLVLLIPPLLPLLPRPKTCRRRLDQHVRHRDRALRNAQWRSMWTTATADAAVKLPCPRTARRTARARPRLCSAEDGGTNAGSTLPHAAEPPLARQQRTEGQPRRRFADDRGTTRCPHRRRYSATTFFRLAYTRPETRGQTRKARRWCLSMVVTVDLSARRAAEACIGGGPRRRRGLQRYRGPPRRRPWWPRIAEKKKVAALPAKLIRREGWEMGVCRHWE